MNRLEQQMVKTLIELREGHGCVGVKAEFEAEGTRLEEAQRLKDVASQAGLPLALKVGGGEDKAGMDLAMRIGATRYIVPMIETGYAMKKALEAKAAVLADQVDISFVANIETITGFENSTEIFEVARDIGGLDGIVLGRVDLTGSMGLSRDRINTDPEVLGIARQLFAKARRFNFETAMGGGVCEQTIPFVKKLGIGLLDHMETRKVIFAMDESGQPQQSVHSILLANLFERNWLENKAAFYGRLSQEDEKRIGMLKERGLQLEAVLQEQAG